MEAHIWEILIGFLWTVFAFVAGIVTHWQATREHRRSSDVPVSENRHTTSSAGPSVRKGRNDEVPCSQTISCVTIKSGTDTA